VYKNRLAGFALIPGTYRGVSVSGEPTEPKGWGDAKCSRRGGEACCLPGTATGEGGAEAGLACEQSSELARESEKKKEMRDCALFAQLGGVSLDAGKESARIARLLGPATCRPALSLHPSPLL